MGAVKILPPQMLLSMLLLHIKHWKYWNGDGSTSAGVIMAIIVALFALIVTSLKLCRLCWGIMRNGEEVRMARA